MPTEFLLASVGAGKTEAAQQRLADLKRLDPYARIWCLLATDRQIYAFRQRLMARPDAAPVYINLEFFTFYGLYRFILENAGNAQRVLDNAARYRLLRLILAQMERDGELDVFASIAQTPGFVRLAADFIYELKQNLLDPQRFGMAARTEKDRELARLYALYQDMLRVNKMVDREGEGWVALDELENDPRLGRDVALLLVDGYDQFNTLQSQVLTLLAGRADEALVTLTQVPGREDTIGKRFERALEKLAKDHRDESVVHRKRTLLVNSGTRHPALGHLLENIFLPGAAQQRTGGGVTFMETPDAPAEVAAALRQAKALVLDGARPDDVLIAVRDWQRYGPYFEAQARAYGLPLAVDGGEALDKNPALYALLRLLEVHRADFRRQPLLDVLHSAYWRIPGIGPDEVDVLERISRERLVTGGRHEWLAALDAAAPPRDEEGETDAEASASAEALQALRTALERFFDAVTPPTGRTPDEYAAWLEDLIGVDAIADVEDETLEEAQAPYALDLIGQVRRPAGGAGIVARDLVALNAFKRVLRGLLSAHRLFTSLEQLAEIGWDSFYTDLQTAVKGTSEGRAAGRDGRVLVTTVTEARGLPHRHVIVLGLSEGIFPMRAAQDPLYLDSERLALRGRGIDLPTQAERTDDDGLFYEMISLATDSLTLTRLTVEDGTPVPESHLWHASRLLFSNAEPRAQRIGRGVPVMAAASLRELAIAVAEGLAAGDAGVGPAHAWWMQQHGGAWEHVAHARAVELLRASRAAHDRYSGRLRDAALVARAGEQFINRTWSATQLNDYGTCAYRFFARRMLRLEPLTEPEEGMDAAQMGSIYHEILEATYRQLAAEGIDILPQNLDYALDVFGDQAARLLVDAPQRHGFRASPLWEQEQQTLLVRLRQVIRDDFDANSHVHKALWELGATGVRRPWRLEAPFGEGNGLTLTVGDRTLRVRGKIDRIDRAGDALVVFDYKSGSTPIDKDEIARGRNFQMMIYLLAVAALDGAAELTVAGGAFWHLSGRKMTGRLTPDAEEIEEGRRHIGAYLARGVAGDFSAEANKMEDGRCSRHCDFSKLCRMGVMGRGKTGAPAD